MKKLIGVLMGLALLPVAFMAGCGNNNSGPTGPGSPTRTRTATATPTVTLTPSVTSTKTATATSISTNTLTVTATGTSTKTVTVTSTQTETPTTTATPLVTQAPVNLGSASTYAVLGASDLTNSGSTNLCGDLGLWAGTSIGAGYVFSCGGVSHVTDTAAQTAQGDLTIAMGDAAGRTNPASVSGDLGGLTITPGLYASSGTLALTGTLILDAQGDPNAVFIFQIAGTLTTATSSLVTLNGGAKATNVFWNVGTSCALGATSSFKGTIMTGTLIAFNTGAALEGRALAKTEVTMLANTISVPVP